MTHRTPLDDWLENPPADSAAFAAWAEAGLATGGNDLRAIADLLKEFSADWLGRDLKQAEHTARLLVELGHYFTDARTQALGEMALGDALRLQTRYDEGYALLDLAARRFEEAGEELGWARTRIGWLGHLYTRPNPPDPEPTAMRALAIFERYEQWHWYALICNNYALHLLNGKDGARATRWAHRQFEAAARLDGAARTVQEFRALGSLIESYTTIGHYPNAKQYVQLILPLLDDPALSPDLRATHTLSVARFYLNFGEYSQALAYLNRAEPDVRSDDLLFHYRDLRAACNLRLNRLDAAERLLRAMLADSAGRQETILQASYCRSHLARLLRQKDECEEALALLQEVTHTNRQHRMEGWMLAAYTDLLLVAHGAQRPDLMAHAREQIARWNDWDTHSFFIVEAQLAIARTAASPAEQQAALARALVGCDNVPWLRWRVHQIHAELAPAIQPRLKWLAKAADDLDEVQNELVESIHADFLHDAERVYHDLALSYLALGDIPAAWQSIERAKNRLLLNARRREVGGDRRMAALQLELEGLLLRHFALMNAQREGSIGATEQIVAVEQQILRCQEAINVRAGGHGSRQPGTIEPPPVAPAGRTLVGYFLVDRECHAFIHDGREYSHVRLPATPALLRELVSGLDVQLMMCAALTPEQQYRSLRKVQQILQRVAELLIRPLIHLIPGAALIVVPFGDLHRLPFHLLWLDDRYLLERFDLRIVPTASLAAPDQQQASGRRHHVVVAHSAYGALSHTLAEAKVVERRLGRDTLTLHEADATREALLAQLHGGLGVLHIAAHGQLRFDHPRLSHIALEGAQLTLGDLMAYRVDASLVTLSACETTRAAVRAGDDPMSMARAFLAAGARSLLGSLWLLDDEAALELMDQFYGYLMEGATKADALRSVWQRWITHPDTHKRHPFYWGALQLIGDGGEL